MKSWATDNTQVQVMLQCMRRHWSLLPFIEKKCTQFTVVKFGRLLFV